MIQTPPAQVCVEIELVNLVRADILKLLAFRKMLVGNVIRKGDIFYGQDDASPDDRVDRFAIDLARRSAKTAGPVA